MLSPVMQQVHSNKKAILGWTLYDFANSAFTTLVVTFVYGTYFASGIVSDKLRGMELWSLGITVSAIIIAILSTVLGALADAGGHYTVVLSLGILTAKLSSTCQATPAWKDPRSTFPMKLWSVEHGDLN